MLSFCFLKEKSIEKIQLLYKYVWRKHKIKKVNEIDNFFIKKIDENELMNNKNENVCTTLNYTEHFLTLVFVVNGCISISTFAF